MLVTASNIIHDNIVKNGFPMYNFFYHYKFLQPFILILILLLMGDGS